MSEGSMATLAELFELALNKRHGVADEPCWKCKADEANRVQMPGQYRAVLCPACCKAWDTAMLATNEALWLDYQNKKLRASIGMDAHTPDVAERMMAFRIAEIELLRLAMAWAPKPGTVVTVTPAGVVPEVR